MGKHLEEVQAELNKCGEKDPWNGQRGRLKSQCRKTNTGGGTALEVKKRKTKSERDGLCQQIQEGSNGVRQKMNSLTEVDGGQWRRIVSAAATPQLSLSGSG